MTAQNYTREQLWSELTFHAVPLINQWLAQGKKVAIYENAEFGHPELGHKKYTTFGTEASQLGEGAPPERLPDIGDAIGWRYVLVGIYGGPQL